MSTLVELPLRRDSTSMAQSQSGPVAFRHADKTRFVVNLLSHDTGVIEVRSCEIIGETFRNRTSFATSQTVATIFEPRVAEGIQRGLVGLRSGHEVLSLPDVVIQVPGALLAQVHLLVSRARDGSEAIILRFRSFLGTVGALLKRDVAMAEEPAALPEKLACDVLADIVLPLLNICESCEAGHVSDEERLRAFLTTLDTRADELKFRARMLQRFMEHATEKTGPDRVRLMTRERGRALDDSSGAIIP